MKKIEIAIIIGFILSIFISTMLPVTCDCQKLKSDVIRLHVLANSDKDYDQELKLKVKDKISLFITNIVNNAKNKEEAKTLINKNLQAIVNVSEKEIIKNGYRYNVDVKLDRSYFTTRKYDTFTLPAGVYDAVKVIIGNGDGHNWWCVAFPPMCSPISDNAEIGSDVLDERELEMIKSTCKYEYKFAIIEIISNIHNKLINSF